MRKIAFTALFISVLILSTIATVQVSKGIVLFTDPADWYKYVTGVLDTDTYVNYPFSKTSLNLGFSKFGEFINPIARPGTSNFGVGLEYANPTDPRDPFANEGIPVYQWINGWLINITYVSSILEPPLRNVWAFALFSDFTEAGVGKDWQHVARYTPGAGGRQTNGWAVTDPIRVLQNGPRRFIAVCTTHLYDDYAGTPYPLVDIDFTIIFDKAEKNVLVLKDIHYRMGPKEAPPLNIQFSNRGEWDLGPPIYFRSQAKYFHQVMPTCYGSNWLLTPWILRDVYDLISIPTGSSLSGEAGPKSQMQGIGILQAPGAAGQVYQLGCPLRTPPTFPAVVGSEIVTVNGVLQTLGTDYTDDWAGGPNRNDDLMKFMDMVAISFLHDIVGPATIKIEYKNVMKELKWWDDTNELWYENPNLESHYYDVAQFISDDSPTPKYVGFAAFWPTCSDYTVDGWMKKFVNLWATPSVFSDQVVTSPIKKIPFLIGEWDLLLDYETTQFRGVTKYGIVDYHDAYNNPATGTSDDVIDREILYQLDEVFNPWDLSDAVQSYVKPLRMVEHFYDADLTVVGGPPGWPVVTGLYLLIAPPMSVGIDLTGQPPYGVSKLPYWQEYCSFAPRVELDGVVIKPAEVFSSVPPTTHEPFYTITGNVLVVWVWDATLAKYVTTYDTTADEWVKILYSIGPGDGPPGAYEWITVGQRSAAVDSAGAAMISEYFDSMKDIVVWSSGLDMQDTTHGPNVPFIFSPLASGTYKDSLGRAHVKDDWCTSIPIETSNIIVVGGPGANLGAYYLNDFTPAFWDSANSQIVALSCWSQQAYRNGWDGPFLLDTRTGAWVAATGTVAGDVGYAVISTYKDKNQTVWFEVWGRSGQDTFYASWAFLWWNDGGWLGEKLQSEPDCLTTLVVKIDYSKHPYEPCFITVVESLGTISEYNWPKQTVTFTMYGGTEFWVTGDDGVPPGIDTSTFELYLVTGDGDGTPVTNGFTIFESGRLVFDNPTTGDFKCIFWLKQPPIHPCRPVPVVIA